MFPLCQSPGSSYHISTAKPFVVPKLWVLADFGPLEMGTGRSMGANYSGSKQGL